MNTGGGSVVQGSASTGGGDFVGRDQVNINLDLGKEVDLGKVLHVLQNALPENDQTAEKLSALLRQFSQFHAQLYACKELHNGLNDIILALDPFKLGIERTYIKRKAPDMLELSQNWRPVRQKIQILLDFAACANAIITQPFAVLAAGVQGPAWAVEVHTATQRIDALMEMKKADPAELYDAAFDFDDIVERHMYLADKQLRETTAGLYALSSQVLRSLGHDQV